MNGLGPGPFIISLLLKQISYQPMTFKCFQRIPYFLDPIRAMIYLLTHTPLWVFWQTLELLQRPPLSRCAPLHHPQSRLQDKSVQKECMYTYIRIYIRIRQFCVDPKSGYMCFSAELVQPVKKCLIKIREAFVREAFDSKQNNILWRRKSWHTPPPTPNLCICKGSRLLASL